MRAGQHSEAARGLFVVGCPRSGTTFLQSILAAHRDIAAFTESHFFTTHMNCRFGLYRIGAKLPDRIREFQAENGLDGLPVELPRTGIMSPRAAVKEAAKCVGLFEAAARMKGKRVWLEKTPHNLLRIPLLSAAAPMARFIHIVREPASAMASLRAAQAQWSPKGPPSWEEAARIWRQAADISLAHRGRHLTVIYEDLVERRKALTPRILAWAGLDADGYDLDGYTKAAEALITGRETWKAGNTSARAQDVKPRHEPPPASLVDALGLSKLYAELRAGAMA